MIPQTSDGCRHAPRKNLCLLYRCKCLRERTTNLIPFPIRRIAVLRPGRKNTYMICATWGLLLGSVHFFWRL
jgi:hypothetical protein